MRKLLNSLYITTQKTYLKKEGETIVVMSNRKKIFQIPMHNLESIVTFGNVAFSPFLVGACAKKKISISLMSQTGKFLASIRGALSGNVLLRREQYRIADCLKQSLDISSNIITGKIANSRVVLNRSIRDHGEKINKIAILNSINSLDTCLKKLNYSKDLEALRGIEGMSANAYFNVFDHLILNQKDVFVFSNRNRRPPLDEVNAMLSFVYTILTHDMRSAIETVGLDPMVGFLHRDRPGRPSLALDLIEEFRPVLADRLVLSLINRHQIGPKGFKKLPNGEVIMNDETKKTILVEYQNRKKEKIYHPFIEENVEIGLLFFIQANLMARFIRGDIDGYPPFLWR